MEKSILTKEEKDALRLANDILDEVATSIDRCRLTDWCDYYSSDEIGNAWTIINNLLEKGKDE